MRKIRFTLILTLLTAGFFITSHVEAKILAECEAVQELTKAKIPRSLISNWVCLMESVSGLDTQLVTGPKTASSYNYGIFQISSLKWCSRGHSGGICNKRCEDFANDDIQDDIECAKRIQNMEGFKAWDGWVKNCKNKPLPNIGNCRRR
ncbi:Lysozyme c-1 [Anthophora retusa]